MAVKSLLKCVGCGTAGSWQIRASGKGSAKCPDVGAIERCLGRELQALCSGVCQEPEAQGEKALPEGPSWRSHSFSEMPSL